MREVSSSVNWRLDREVKIVTETERRREKARGGKKHAIAKVSAIHAGQKDLGSHKPARGKTDVAF